MNQAELNTEITRVNTDIVNIGRKLNSQLKKGNPSQNLKRDLDLVVSGKRLLADYISFISTPTFLYKITVSNVSTSNETITIDINGETINGSTDPQGKTDLTIYQMAANLSRTLTDIYTDSDNADAPRLYSFLLNDVVYIYSVHADFLNYTPTITISDDDIIAATSVLTSKSTVLEQINNGFDATLFPNIIDVTKEYGSDYGTQAVDAGGSSGGGSTDHTQNTDTKLAQNTINEVTASELRTHLDNDSIHKTITEIQADTDLNDLNDVNAGSPANTQVLTWDTATSKWIAADASGGSGTLEDLTDTDVSSKADDDLLKYNSGSGNWENFAIQNPTIVTPTIYGNETGSNIWALYENDGTTPYSLLSGALTNQSITVDTGVKVEASAYFKYPVVGAGYKGPDSISGNFGSTDPGENTNSATKTHTDLEGSVITSSTATTKSYSVTLTAAKQGLVVSGSNVVVASGNDTSSDTIAVVFANRIYFGYSTNTSLTEAQIKALTTVRFGDNSETFTGVTATSGNYVYFCYDNSNSDLTSIILDGASPILGAFSQIGTVNITNPGGISKTLKVYRSNATNAFSNASLAFS